MTYCYTVWSLSSSPASRFRSRALFYIICNAGLGLHSPFIFPLLPHKLLLSPEPLASSPLLPPPALSMGHSWSKHCVLHIILWQSPPAVISLWSRCNSWANFLIYLTGGCLTGSVLAKLMSSHFNSIYNSWCKHFFFYICTYTLSHQTEPKPSFAVCFANDLRLTMELTHFWGGGAWRVLNRWLLHCCSMTNTAVWE